LRTSSRDRPPPCQHVCRRSAACRWLSMAPATQCGMSQHVNGS
jgi:hypothetical protein